MINTRTRRVERDASDPDVAQMAYDWYCESSNPGSDEQDSDEVYDKKECEANDEGMTPIMRTVK